MALQPACSLPSHPRSTSQEWEGALTPLSVSNVEKGQALRRMGDAYARRHRPALRRGLKGTGLNEMKALAVSSIDGSAVSFEAMIISRQRLRRPGESILVHVFFKAVLLGKE